VAPAAEGEGGGYRPSAPATPINEPDDDLPF